MAHRRLRNRRQRVANGTPTTTLGEIDSLLSEPLEPGELVDPNNAPDLVLEATLQEIEDRRQWGPEGGRSAPRSVSGEPARVIRPTEIGRVVARTREFMEFPERMQAKMMAPFERVKSAFGFDIPGKVIQCVRRKVRREVMFALPERRRRKGAGANRRRNEWSDIKC